MRRVNSNSPDEINAALREIFDHIDLMRSKNIDMSKRRVVNAHPSIDDYDYVVRKELRPIETKIKEVSKGDDYYTIVFAQDGVLTLGDKNAPPFIVQQAGKPTHVKITAVTPPTTNMASINVKLNGVAILNSDLVLPITATSQQVFTSTDIVDGTAFAADDVININVTSAGSVSTEKTTIEIWVRKF